MGLAMIMTSATIVGVVYFLAYRNPRDFSFSHALGVLALALAATASGEYSREMLRKPFVVGQFLYCNGTRVSRVAEANQAGYLARTGWVAGQTGRARGEAMYRGQCGACHTRDGYRSLRRLLAGRNREAVGGLLNVLHEFRPDSPYRNFMPPLAAPPRRSPS